MRIFERLKLWFGLFGGQHFRFGTQADHIRTHAAGCICHNYMTRKVCDKITYPFLNFNGWTVEV